jgi:hypothetical protein
MAGTLGRAVHHVQVSRADPTYHLYHERHREFQPAAPEGPKTKSAFVSDDALLKQLYLVTMQVTNKWTMPLKDWGSILMHLMIFFGDRVNMRL